MLVSSACLGPAAYAGRWGTGLMTAARRARAAAKAAVSIVALWVTRRRIVPVRETRGRSECTMARRRAMAIDYMAHWCLLVEHGSACFIGARSVVPG